jgi:hypothetical protein
MTTDAGAGSPYKVSGYPTIKLFGKDKKSPIDYSSGERTFDKFIDFCMKHLNKQVENNKKNVESSTS